ncbi:MFS transporter [Vibrio viridaestus]|uniref:MFS transporter n=1 Tax=Vibrio viridaestus TaxID=2487322 RepID=A0A3N9U4S2_9VIBR|nr:MFS transporter [Vibrio viridaestus]RQW64652.1 MFS transporter [Vibrio viridaestus]
MNIAIPRTAGMPLAVYALSAGSFGIGTTEFVIMGLLLSVASDFHVSMTIAAYSISAYAFGVVVGAPLLTPLLSRFPKKPVLLVLMLIFSTGNLLCGLSDSMTFLVIARVVTAFIHASFFGISSVYAAEIAPPSKRASAVSSVFLGATLANILGVPFGAWIGQLYGWRYAFFMVTVIGCISAVAILALIPNKRDEPSDVPKIRNEIRALANFKVLKSLLITAFGFSGVFTTFTYIEPMLQNISLMNVSTIPSVLLLFGVGMVVGNHFGGKLTDKGTQKTLITTLSFLFLILCLFPLAIQTKTTACIAVFLLGTAMFATIPPLQVQALDSTQQSKSMISSCNIAAFNLGNAVGAWFGGILIAFGVSLLNIPIAGAFLTLVGLAIACLKSK